MSINPDGVALPSERLSWLRTADIGTQYAATVFGAAFLVPLLAGLPSSTTLSFIAIGTLLFFLITAGRLPSYLGSPFALITPIQAVNFSMGPSYALGGITTVGAMLALVGLIVHFTDVRWIDATTPPTVTGAIVVLTGLDLIPAAWDWTKQGPVTTVMTIVSICAVTVLFKDILSHLSILIGILIGYLATIHQGEVDFFKVSSAAQIGFLEFHTSAFFFLTLGLLLPVVFILATESVDHMKSVSAMMGEDIDDLTGRTLVADGPSMMLADSGGGSGMTTCTENIGVMVATRVYLTTAYVIVAGVALVLPMPPKFGAFVATIPSGVFGDAGTILYGMIGMPGVHIWVQNHVDFPNPMNLSTAAIAPIVAVANFTWVVGNMTSGSIALDTTAALLTYHGIHLISKLCGTNLEAATPASVSSGSELEGEAYSKRHRSLASQADV